MVHAGADAVYARFYVKFSPDYQYNHHFVWLGANQRTNKWSAFWQSRVEAERHLLFHGHGAVVCLGQESAPRRTNLYTYYLDMEPDRKMNKYWATAFFRRGQEKALPPARLVSFPR